MEKRNLIPRADAPRRMKKFEISRETHDAIVDAARKSPALSAEQEDRFQTDIHDPRQSGPVSNTLSFFVNVRSRVEIAGGGPTNDRSKDKKDPQTNKE